MPQRGFQPCPTCPSPQECMAAGTCMQEAAGGGGMPPPPGGGMPPTGMKKGGRVKKKPAMRKAYKEGGAVRGAGKAKQGVRKCKMR
jgi:hypothetical protein